MWGCKALVWLFRAELSEEGEREPKRRLWRTQAHPSAAKEATSASAELMRQRVFILHCWKLPFPPAICAWPALSVTLPPRQTGWHCHFTSLPVSVVLFISHRWCICVTEANRAAQTSSFCVVPVPGCRWPHIVLSRDNAEQQEPLSLPHILQQRGSEEWKLNWVCPFPVKMTACRTLSYFCTPPFTWPQKPLDLVEQKLTPCKALQWGALFLHKLWKNHSPLQSTDENQASSPQKPATCNSIHSILKVEESREMLGRSKHQDHQEWSTLSAMGMLLCCDQWLLHSTCFLWCQNAPDSPPCQDVMLFSVALTASWLCLHSIFILEHVLTNNSGWDMCSHYEWKTALQKTNQAMHSCPKQHFNGRKALCARY